jgi:DNA repair exonuclease SbcCD nuclease subunit
MRFIHSSDLQIGKTFGFFEADVASLLQDARQAAVGTLGELAMRHDAQAVLLAGDIFDKQQLSQITLAKPIEAMRRFPKVNWHLLPGNHDHVRDNGLWDRLTHSQLPANVNFHVAAGAVSIADDAAVFLLPAPLRYISSVDDLTAYMDSDVTPEGAIRIGMAHGSIQGFDSDGETSNYISPNRADSAGLSYLALGDWHRQMKVNDRTWYSGTPEPDRFKLPPNATDSRCNGGAALLVDIPSARATPTVTALETGRYRWHRVQRILTEDGQIDRLETDLRALAPNLERVVLYLEVSGAISLAGRKAFEDKITQSIAAAVCGLRLDDRQLILEPTEADLDEIDRAGFVRVAADRLKAMAADDSDRSRAQIAALALKRLFLENLRSQDRP